MSPQQDNHVFAYRFNEKITKEIAQIWSIGWENQTSHLYNWKGSKRKEDSMYVFQYTISGIGAIELGDKEYKLTPGKAFLIDIADEYRYYLPQHSTHWEFLFITLYGEKVKDAWDYIQRENQAIISLSSEAAPIKQLLHMYQMAKEKNIKNAFQASHLAYEFIMELYQFTKQLTSVKLPESILNATLFAQNHYQEAVGPDEMADAAGLSRYHFTRMFKKSMGITPIQYLTNLRLVKAAELLYQTNQAIEEIAVEVGFANANYFTKVFRKVTGMTPGQFRKKRISPSEDLFA
ncbi:AraC family transcriptional regulator [Bacillus sp. B1-b2]|uniref:AraC family transcriptional regulator n=1 Tax=Bacillus sp. B1-b2 TaxID=2653201 RepID=UPI001261E485|nr:AraC family transcriptional regulator [Bacillus sp. B1-b2]KAB7667599.1 AraC family transcriptional regulator [Bacillus sp. B1-b2]